MTSRLDAMGIKTHSLENRDNLDEFHASPWIGVTDIGNGRYAVTVAEVVEAEMQDMKTGTLTMKDTLVFAEPKIKCALPLNETNFNVMRNAMVRFRATGSASGSSSMSIRQSATRRPAKSPAASASSRSTRRK